jgi:hypothetical protein
VTKNVTSAASVITALLKMLNIFSWHAACFAESVAQAFDTTGERIVQMTVKAFQLKPGDVILNVGMVHETESQARDFVKVLMSTGTAHYYYQHVLTIERDE